MQAVSISNYDINRDNLTVVERPVRKPGWGQVLVKIAASPINPSDVIFLEGRYGVKKPLPITPGFEASGMVVAAGWGVMSKALVGRRVACSGPNDGDGTWAEYMVTQASLCMPLLSSVSDEQGAMALVNPLTAWGMMAIARQEKHAAVVQSAAASALGRMVIRLGIHFNLPTINIVRRQRQVALLQSLGARYVLNSNDADFEERLKSLCRQLKATIAFDAVAGEMTGQLLKAMPRRSKLLIYGALSNKACLVDPTDPLFGDKVMTGFWLSSWLPRLNPIERLRVGYTVQTLLGDVLQTEIQARVSLNEAVRGLKMYTQNMTKGKVLIVPELNTD